MDDEWDDDEILIKCMVRGDPYCKTKSLAPLFCYLLTNPGSHIKEMDIMPIVFDNSTLTSDHEVKTQKTKVNMNSSWISGDEYETVNMEMPIYIELLDMSPSEEEDRLRCILQKGADVQIFIVSEEREQRIRVSWMYEEALEKCPDAQFVLIHSPQLISDLDGYFEFRFNEIDPVKLTNLAKAINARACIAIDFHNMNSIQYVRSRIGEIFLDQYTKETNEEEEDTNCVGLKRIYNSIMFYFAIIILLPFIVLYKILFRRKENIGDAVRNLRNKSLSTMSIGLVSYSSDIVLDFLVLRDFILNDDWKFFVSMLSVMILSQAATGFLYILNMKETNKYCAFFTGFFYCAMFQQIYQSVVDGAPTILFRRIRIMESVLEAIPSSLLTSYWIISGTLDKYTDRSLTVFYLSLFSSFFSIARSLTKYETETFKVGQFSSKFVAIFMTRFAEIYSRIMILGILAFITRNYLGLLMLLSAEYIAFCVLLLQKREYNEPETWLMPLMYMAVYPQNITADTLPKGISLRVVLWIRLIEFVVITVVCIYNVYGLKDEQFLILWENIPVLITSAVGTFFFSFMFIVTTKRRCYGFIDEETEKFKVSIDNVEEEYRKTLQKIKEENASGIWKTIPKKKPFLKNQENQGGKTIPKKPQKTKKHQQVRRAKSLFLF